MKTTPVLVTLVMVLLVMSACNTTKNAYYYESKSNYLSDALPDESNIERTLYLIGDPAFDQHRADGPVMQYLEQYLTSVNDKSAVVFLGNYVSPSGLPKKNNEKRELAETPLKQVLTTVEGYNGDLFFLPGNRDWNNGKEGGLKDVKRIEKFLEKPYKKEEVEDEDEDDDKEDEPTVFMPDNGCGDPIRVKLEKDLVLIMLNSQWWLQDWDKERKINNGCEVKSRIEMIEEFEELILKNKNKRIVVLMHHPLFSSGNHGGKFSMRQHFFPLTDVKKGLWIPLPIVGSFYPYFRSTSGTRQDIIHYRYQEMKDRLLKALLHQKNIIFASGHEQGLQYFNEGGHHHITSGSAGKAGFIRGASGAKFAHSAEGFAKLYYYKDQSIWLEFITINDSLEAAVKFRKEIVPPKPGGQDQDLREFAELPDSVTMAASLDYKAGAFKKFWLGKQYRKAWEQEVTIPVINLSEEMGGLTPIKKGGGLSSNSLRVVTEDGQQWVLRSVNKDLSKILPPELKKVRMAGLLKDQASAIHPYSALTIPKMADAIGVYHANPRLVYMPHQKGLGAYNDLFNEEMYLMEERPAGNWEDLESFGNSKKIIGYIDLLPKLADKHSHVVDQEWVLKSRLFDIFIHDWDRHDDQWRWARFKTDEKTYYRPIPRDRDQTYYQFKGVLPGLAANLAMRKFRTFKHDLKSTHWQSFNARYFDRYFLSEMDKDDWLAAIKHMQVNLTDEIIEEAFEIWPENIFEIDGPITIDRLKSRRDKMESIGLKLYKFISRSVNVVGTNQRDRFEVVRQEDGNTLVTVIGMKKSGKLKDIIYQRLFIKGETKQIHLYGLDDEDEFILTGKASKGIKVRIIGGEQNDVVIDSSKVGGFGKKTIVYDNTDGIEITSAGETTDRTSNKTDVNEYDREAFIYNMNFSFVNLGYTPDERFWLGAKTTFTTHGFRKDPYKAKHTLAFKVAPTAARAFDFFYESDFLNVFGKFDLLLRGRFSNPIYVNYFGVGNETVQTSDDFKFNWVKMEQFRIDPLIKKNFARNRYQFHFGPTYQSYEVNRVTGRVANDPEFGLDDEDREVKHYLGGRFAFVMEVIDNPNFPKQGIKNEFSAEYLKRIDKDENLASLGGSSTIYITFGQKVTATIASRMGAATVFEDRYFYNNPSLGNSNYLRGWRNDRFSGKTIFYHNTDLRIKLFHWGNRFLPGDVGITGGFDYGRVFEPGEISKMYHTGYTVGIWYSPLSMIAIHPHYTISEEERLFNFQLGFAF
ncbi:MAG: hypothetical protein AAF502_19365 [Bacteroidota bacterium]